MMMKFSWHAVIKAVLQDVEISEAKITGLRGKLNKVVLAYSGGLDTSVVVPWLRYIYLVLSLFSSHNFKFIILDFSIPYLFWTTGLFLSWNIYNNISETFLGFYYWSDEVWVLQLCMAAKKNDTSYFIFCNVYLYWIIIYAGLSLVYCLFNDLCPCRENYGCDVVCFTADLGQVCYRLYTSLSVINIAVK